ncbi:MAG: hypothetical protein Q4P06_06745 [Actinomycetaceae bacterium]|nr:hypothetical protein [Actinomycetaceae bacterium]
MKSLLPTLSKMGDLDLVSRVNNVDDLVVSHIAHGGYESAVLAAVMHNPCSTQTDPLVVMMRLWSAFISALT